MSLKDFVSLLLNHGRDLCFWHSYGPERSNEATTLDVTYRDYRYLLSEDDLPTLRQLEAFGKIQQGYYYIYESDVPDS